jgi:hypothetical protein
MAQFLIISQPMAPAPTRNMFSWPSRSWWLCKTDRRRRVTQQHSVSSKNKLGTVYVCCDGIRLSPTEMFPRSPTQTHN